MADTAKKSAHLESERALAVLRYRYPGVLIWHGGSTGEWFTLLGRGREAALIEASSSAELGRLLDAAGSHSTARPVSGPAGTGGLVSAVWSSPVHPPRLSSERRPPSPPRSSSVASRSLHLSGTRGRHEAARRRGWVRRLLDAVTWNRSRSP